MPRASQDKATSTRDFERNIQLINWEATGSMPICARSVWLIRPARLRANMSQHGSNSSNIAHFQVASNEQNISPAKRYVLIHQMSNLGRKLREGWAIGMHKAHSCPPTFRVTGTESRERITHGGNLSKEYFNIPVSDHIFKIALVLRR